MSRPLDNMTDFADAKRRNEKEEVAMKDEDDICGLCGLPGADKIAHPVHWPGEQVPDGQFVHAKLSMRSVRERMLAYHNRNGTDS